MEGLQTEPQVSQEATWHSGGDLAVGGRDLGRPLFCGWESAQRGRKCFYISSSVCMDYNSLSVVLVPSASLGLLSEIHILGSVSDPLIKL